MPASDMRKYPTNYENHMITLPLPNNMARCLAHGEFVGDWCHKRDTCARNLTIREDEHDAMYSAMYRACTSDIMAAYIPIEGFPAKDEE